MLLWMMRGLEKQAVLTRMGFKRFGSTSDQDPEEMYFMLKRELHTTFATQGEADKEIKNYLIIFRHSSSLTSLSPALLRSRLKSPSTTATRSFE